MSPGCSHRTASFGPQAAAERAGETSTAASMTAEAAAGEAAVGEAATEQAPLAVQPLSETTQSRGGTEETAVGSGKEMDSRRGLAPKVVQG